MTAILERREERAALARWLAGHTALAVSGPDDVRIAAPASGWSNETVIADVAGTRVVVRLAPRRLSMFPDYDLDKEWSILTALHAAGRVPVPEPLAEDVGGSLFGRPLFVMGFVDGLAPSDTRPGYAEKGWLVDGSVAERRRFWDGLLAAMAGVHDTDRRTPALQRLAPPEGRSSLEVAVDWLAGLHAWSAAPQAEIDAALARLRATLPTATGPDVLLWGDGRPANVLVRNFRIVALLDWELATVGPVELDVTWLQEMHWMRTTGSGIALPEGFPDDAAIARGYETASGRRLEDLRWYRLLAATKVAVLLYRHLVVAIDRGGLPAGHPLLRDNIATRRLATLLA